MVKKTDVILKERYGAPNERFFFQVLTSKDLLSYITLFQQLIPCQHHGFACKSKKYKYYRDLKSALYFKFDSIWKNRDTFQLTPKNFKIAFENNYIEFLLFWDKDIREIFKDEHIMSRDRFFPSNKTFRRCLNNGYLSSIKYLQELIPASELSSKMYSSVNNNLVYHIEMIKRGQFESLKFCWSFFDFKKPFPPSNTNLMIFSALKYNKSEILEWFTSTFNLKFNSIAYFKTENFDKVYLPTYKQISLFKIEAITRITERPILVPEISEAMKKLSKPLIRFPYTKTLTEHYVRHILEYGDLELITPHVEKYAELKSFSSSRLFDKSFRRPIRGGPEIFEFYTQTLNQKVLKIIDMDTKIQYFKWIDSSKTSDKNSFGLDFQRKKSSNSGNNYFEDVFMDKSTCYFHQLQQENPQMFEEICFKCKILPGTFRKLPRSKKRFIKKLRN